MEARGRGRGRGRGGATGAKQNGAAQQNNVSNVTSGNFNQRCNRMGEAFSKCYSNLKTIHIF